MISLDQVLLLQEKVESAVERIQQLTAENDALRSKCAELTKALTAKTELVSTLESNQDRIETGILSALNRLNDVENSILDGEQNTQNVAVLAATEPAAETNITKEAAAENQHKNEIQEPITENTEKTESSGEITIPVQNTTDIY